MIRIAELKHLTALNSSPLLNESFIDLLVIPIWNEPTHHWLFLLDAYLFIWSIFCSRPLNLNCIPNNIAQVAFIKQIKALDCYLSLCWIHASLGLILFASYFEKCYFLPPGNRSKASESCDARSSQEEGDEIFRPQENRPRGEAAFPRWYNCHCGIPRLKCHE